MPFVGRYDKSVITIESPDRHVSTMYDSHVGDDYQVVEITYERKK